MRVPAFVGPSYTARSVCVDAERTINLYPEVVDGGATGKNRVVYYGTPGLSPFVTLPDGPVRALWELDGRCLAAGSSRLYEVYGSQTAVERGTIEVDRYPATMCSNGTAGHQVFVTSGGHGYIFDTISNELTEIADPDFPTPVRMGGFVDGYFIALKAHSRQFWYSDLEDGTVWNGLDVAEISQSGDNLQALAISHRELWLFGSQVTHVWRNVGDRNNPFEPVSGAPIEHGILAPFSVVVMDNTLYWLGADATGSGVVWKANGYTPERVSSHAVEYWLGKASSLEDAMGWAYLDEGHLFYVLYVPTADTTWVYDVATGLWHERAMWDTDRMVWTPHAARCHCFAFGKHLVGDRRSGAIYELSLDNLDDELVGWDPAMASTSPSVSPSRSASMSPSRSASMSASVSPSVSASASA